MRYPSPFNYPAAGLAFVGSALAAACRCKCVGKARKETTVHA